jgi:hypothetical protein
LTSVAARYAVAVFAVILLGLVAGLLLGTGMTNYTAKGLPEASWTTGFQYEDALFGKVMPSFFITTLVALTLSGFLTRGSARGFFFAAAILALAVIVISVKGEVPLNKQIQSWVPGAAPANWADVRDRWLSNHLWRTIAGMVGFVCAAIGLARM